MDDSVKNSVLIVDDESSNITALTHYLSPDYTIYAVKDGKNAIKLAEKQQPDVILLDIILPDMDGYSIITALKESETTRHIPVIFISSLTDAVDEEKGLSLGAVDYITKPFSAAIVKLRVGNQIKNLNHIHTIEKIMQSLEAAANAKTYFLANMSHDFKTPLTVISLYIQDVMDMLTFEVDKDSIEESLSGANQEVMRMARLVDSAMNHSLMYDNSYAMLPIDIATLIRKGTQTYNILMERNDNILSFDIEDSLPNVFGNADMLLLVLSNLLSNANRYTRAGEIKIIARAELPLPKDPEKKEMSRKFFGYVRITVKDNGCGVKPEVLPNIFQRGISEGSTGLGLSICQSTIEAHRGKIGIESTLGEGTSVWFTIPISKTE